MAFGIKSLFAAVTAVAVALVLVVAAPDIVAVGLLVLVHVALAAGFLVGLVDGSPARRAFCLGAMIPAGATIVGLTATLSFLLIVNPNSGYLVQYFDRLAITLRAWSVMCWILELVAGCLAWAAQRPMARRSDGE
jgi:hypothetical protein